MKHLTTVVGLILISFAGNTQPLQFKVKGLKDTTILLAYYYGPQIYAADTAYSRNGKFEFNGDKHPGGLYSIVLPGGTFDFIHDNEPVKIVLKDIDNIYESITIKKSENNKVMYEFLKFMSENNKLENLAEEKESLEEGTAEYEEVKSKIDLIHDQILNFKKELIKNNEDLFIADMIKMTMDVELPDFVKNEEGVVVDSVGAYQYYANHYWDGLDFQDERIIRTPGFHSKLDNYFSDRGLLQHPDSLIKYADLIMSKINPEEGGFKVYRYVANHITAKYEASNIMGMDKVFFHMVTTYYCANEEIMEIWNDFANLGKICERAMRMGRVIIGNKAPLLILPDTTENNWINLYEVEAEYTVLFFWDPDCGHCKKEAPKLQELYAKKLKERNIEVYAVSNAAGEDFEKWKDFIVENGLSFINVGLTRSVYNQAMEDPTPLLKYTNYQSLNYNDTYDIYSTPTIFILGPDKKILYKNLTIHQVEDILDKLTGHENDPKLFPAYTISP